MSKTDQTETLLMDALARLLAGSAERTDGTPTQANVAKEAGLSRATFNRYPAVVEAWRKAREPAADQASPEKSKRTRETVDALRKELAVTRQQWEEELAAARQEIMVLNVALQQRNETIATLRRNAGKDKVAVLVK